MQRRLLNLLTVLSLLLCVAVVILWVRSYWRADYVRIQGWYEWKWISTTGQLTVYRVVDEERTFELRAFFGPVAMFEAIFAGHA
jgi:hypothetical protein